MLTGAGVALVAGMVAAVLTLEVAGIATWYVWVAVVAVGFGPLRIGVVFLRSNEHQVWRRLKVSTGFSLTFTLVATANVWDRYVTHPETPVTTSTVAFFVIALFSVVLTTSAPLVVALRLDPDELRTRSVDVGGLRRWGTASMVLGGLLGAGLVVTSLLVAASVPGTVLGVAVAGSAVVAGVVLMRVTDLRAGYRSLPVVLGLLLAALVSMVVMQPFGYVLLTHSAAGGIVYLSQFVAAVCVSGLVMYRLCRFLGHNGVLPPSFRWPDGQVAR